MSSHIYRIHPITNHCYRGVLEPCIPQHVLIEKNVLIEITWRDSLLYWDSPFLVTQTIYTLANSSPKI